jgi:hypothetical protein
MSLIYTELSGIHMNEKRQTVASLLQSSIGLSSSVTPLGSLSARLLRLLSNSEAPAPAGKLEMLPRPGLRVYRAPTDRTELRLSNSLDVGAGVGVGVGEPSEADSGGGGGLVVREETLGAAEAGDSAEVPLVAVSATWVFTVGASSAVVGDSVLGGTSRLARAAARERSCGLVTLMGKRVAAEAPLERSRRCRAPGAGLVARLRLTMARWRASIAARRLLSSVLMARGRLEVEMPSALD